MNTKKFKTLEWLDNPLSEIMKQAFLGTVEEFSRAKNSVIGQLEQIRNGKPQVETAPPEPTAKDIIEVPQAKN